MEKRDYKWTRGKTLEGYNECIFGGCDTWAESNKNAYYVSYNRKCGYLQFRLKINKRLKKETREESIRELSKFIGRKLSDLIRVKRTILNIDAYNKGLIIRYHFNMANNNDVLTPDEILNVLDKLQEAIDENGF